MWLMIGKPPLDIPLFASYLRSHSTTLRGSRDAMDPFCGARLGPGRAWASLGRRASRALITGVRALRAGQTSTHPPRTQNMSEMCVTFY